MLHGWITYYLLLKEEGVKIEDSQLPFLAVPQYLSMSLRTPNLLFALGHTRFNVMSQAWAREINKYPVLTVSLRDSF